MKGTLRLGALAFSFLAMLSACESGNNAPPVSTHGWTWVSGSNTTGQAGIYGTKGMADPSNVPGARNSVVSWIDPSGKLWLFGGYDTAAGGELNDLWKFDPATVEWTWVSGSSSAYQGGTYGTKGTASPLNVPGARRAAVSWIDPSGKLWLFGGYGLTAPSYGGNLNDLWKFDPTTLEWTWVSGSDTADHGGTYGTKGTTSPFNVPGTRYSAASWIDASGKLWLFGGSGFDSAGWGGFLNDLWKFDPTTLEWTWVSGSNAINQVAVYGTKGTASSLNVPGARLAAAPWIDANGRLWFFGGSGLDSTRLGGDLNDLWYYTR
jgi:N-acetylneuraminic acid mutarotase